MAAVGRPRKTKEKLVRISFTITPENMLWLKKYALLEMKSRSEIIDSLITSQKKDKFFMVDKSTLKILSLKYGFKSLKVFGSVLSKGMELASDIDLLVDFIPSKKVSLFTLAKLEKELEKIFSKKVDLRTVQELSQVFRKKVLLEAVTIYAN